MPLQEPPGSGTLRAVLDTVFASPAYRWAEGPRPLGFLSRWWDRLLEWLQSLEVGSPALFRVLELALSVALLLVLARVAYIIIRTVQGATRSAAPTRAGAAQEPRDADWYRRAADRAAAAGRAREALQLDFIALALTLEAQGLLRYQPGMTPAECAARARLPAGERARLAGLVGTLYAHVFGGRPCGPEDYARWRSESAGLWHAVAH